MIAEPALHPADERLPDQPIPRREVDFGRPLVSILGLPFDAITLAGAVERVRADAFAGRRCFISTPNLNFAVTAWSQPAFRDAVLRSDLSLVDGMPLVWMGRALGLDVPERVSGADLFDALQVHAGPPLSVFVFGGPPEAGRLASERLNRLPRGLRCVGYESPGFGSVESMSSAAQIERINRSGAHFVVVALGAVKGQAWIERNAGRLHAPVLSHLGAVVNFAAGLVQRAPAWVRWAGLEWLWRIKEEPGLWRRYGHDGLAVVQILGTRLLPDAVLSRRGDLQSAFSGTVALSSDRDVTVIACRGAWTGRRLDALDAALSGCARRNARIRIDLSGVTLAGNAFVAMLLSARGWFGARQGMEVVGPSGVLRAQMRRMFVEEALLSNA